MTAQRLDRILANLGYGSRAEVRSLVRRGRVTVDATVARDPSAKAEAEAVRVDGEPLDTPGPVFVALHKPVGYVCSHDDRDGTPVYRLLPPRWTQRNPAPTTVGRLDKDSSGLLLVTDLMPLVHELTSPRRHVPKHYRVTLDRRPGDDLPRLAEVFAEGTLVLDGEPCRPAELRAVEGDDAATAVEVVLTEGRHRQVRRMFGALGYEVVALCRTRLGPYELGDLEPGAWVAVDPSLVGRR